MDINNIDSLTELLTLSISPVALISGVGLLLLSMTNRLGRTIDRARILINDMKTVIDEQEKENLVREIKILYNRSNILRISITFMSSSIFFLSFIIICLFSMFIFDMNLGTLVIVLFMLSMLCMTISIAFFILDLFITLKALKLNIETHI